MPAPKIDILFAGAIAFVGAPFLLHCSRYYFRRANVLTNIFHIAHKLAEKIFGPMHTVEYTDSLRLKKSRYVYTLMSILEKRYSVSKEVIQFPSSAGHYIPIAVYRTPNNTGRNCPAIIYYHGGGYTLGGINMYEHITTAMTDKIGAIVFFVDYRLAPEHRFPLPQQDCIEATEWILSPAQADRFGFDTARVAIAGDSAGGNLVSIMSAEFPDKIKYAVSVYPGNILGGVQTASKERNKTAPVLPATTLDWFHHSHVGDMSDEYLRAHPLFSPLSRPPPPQGSPFPTTHVITADLDPLHDDGVAYVKYLSDAGVPVTHKHYNSVHGFFAISIFPHGQEALWDVCKRIREFV